ncbi:MAG: hypothetical protein H6618_05635 [Deltaproteobacteria bacterium]|nr:hypothetical protein [Deltaproteobacteria bacterium]
MKHGTLKKLCWVFSAGFFLQISEPVFAGDCSGKAIKRDVSSSQPIHDPSVVDAVLDDFVDGFLSEIVKATISVAFEVAMPEEIRQGHDIDSEDTALELLISSYRELIDTEVQESITEQKSKTKISLLNSRLDFNKIQNALSDERVKAYFQTVIGVFSDILRQSTRNPCSQQGSSIESIESIKFSDEERKLLEAGEILTSKVGRTEENESLSGEHQAFLKTLFRNQLIQALRQKLSQHQIAELTKIFQDSDMVGFCQIMKDAGEDPER